MQNTGMFTAIWARLWFGHNSVEPVALKDLDICPKVKQKLDLSPKNDLLFFHPARLGDFLSICYTVRVKCSPF